MAKTKKQEQSNSDSKTRYTKAQIEAWKREMDGKGYDPNSTYFHKDTDR